MKNNNVMMNVYRFLLIASAYVVRLAAEFCFISAFIAETAAENNAFLITYGKEIYLYTLETFQHARKKETAAAKYFLVWFHDSMEFRQDIILQDKYTEMI